VTVFVRRLETAVQYVTDLDASVDWYRRLLDQDPTPYEGPYFPFPDGGYLILHPCTDSTGRGGTGVWFEVADVDDTYQRKISEGFVFNEKPFDIPPGRLVTLNDPDGNIVGFLDNSDGGMPPGSFEQ
jgi:predicted enzyme related to lactoylglutathione lyase